MKKRITVKLMTIGALVLLNLCGGQPALGQDYPQRGITIIVPATPGGANDLQARMLADRLRQSFARPVTVQNKPGASLIVGTEFVGKSAPDGYTLLVAGNSPFSVNPVFFAKLPYDPIRDFEPIGLLSFAPIVLVASQAFPVENVAGLVAYAKQNPGKVFYGAGSSSFRIAVEMFRQATGIEMTHVAYSGSAPVISAMLADTVQLTIVDMATVASHIKAGKLKALAAISQTRALSGLPSLGSSVPGYEMAIWLGAFAPAGTSANIVAMLNAEIRRMVDDPKAREAANALGLELESSSPGALGDRIRRETERFKAAAKTAGIKPE